MSYKYIIAGGGTGGHIFPAIAIANALTLQDPGCTILFVGAKGKMEMEKIPAAGYAIVGLDIAGFNRSSLLKNVTLPFKLLKSFFQVRKILGGFKPDAVIGVGGYSSFPVLRMAQAKGIPTFIHEANSFAGKSNQLLSKKASIVFTAIDGMEDYFPKDRIVISGNPVRKSIVEAHVTREEGIRFFGLNPNHKTVLVVGGSLGAGSVNHAIQNGLNELEQSGIQLIWQTGRPFADQAKKLAQGKQNIWTGDFIAQMEYAYAAADVVVSRAGAMAIAELCVTGKPTLFVPYPYAAEDHQTVNAMRLVEKNAGLIVKDDEVETKLIPAILTLVMNPEQQEALKKNILKLSVKNADVIVAQKIIEQLKKTHRDFKSSLK